MPSETLQKVLVDIRYNIALAIEWVGETSVESFERDLRSFYATTRALEIISEASRRLPDELLRRHPEIPWRSVRDAGNFYRHDYDRVLESFVWSSVRNSLPPLLAVVEEELASIGHGP